jgi:hypothetical protein
MSGCSSRLLTKFVAHLCRVAPNDPMAKAGMLRRPPAGRFERITIRQNLESKNARKPGFPPGFLAAMIPCQEQIRPIYHLVADFSRAINQAAWRSACSGVMYPTIGGTAGLHAGLLYQHPACHIGNPLRFGPCRPAPEIWMAKKS